MQYWQIILVWLCMTIFPHDEFAKSFLENLLSPFGKVEPSYKIAAEVREVDVYFMPSGDNLNHTDLGLLGKCATFDTENGNCGNSSFTEDTRDFMV
jgi:hypothetical protein